MVAEYMVLNMSRYRNEVYYDLIEFAVDLSNDIFVAVTMDFLRDHTDYDDYDKFMKDIVFSITDGKDVLVLHIPVPIFIDELRNYADPEYIVKFFSVLKSRVRDDEFFSCPLCGEKNFYAGLCYDCQSKIDSGEHKEFFDRYILYERYKNYLKEYILGFIKHYGFGKLLRSEHILYIEYIYHWG